MEEERDHYGEIRTILWEWQEETDKSNEYIEEQLDDLKRELEE